MATKRYRVVYDSETVLSTDDLDEAMTCYREDVLQRYAGYRKGGVMDTHKAGYNWIA